MPQMHRNMSLYHGNGSSSSRLCAGKRNPKGYQLGNQDRYVVCSYHFLLNTTLFICTTLSLNISFFPNTAKKIILGITKLIPAFIINVGQTPRLIQKHANQDITQQINSINTILQYSRTYSHRCS